jgi:hypothetical protein
MKNFILQLDLISLLLGAILGSVIAIWLDLYIKRPKLIINGGGSGNRPDGTKGNHISIYNEIGWFGLNIAETRILGLRIHPFLRLGLPFQKTDAKDCRAQLFLADTNEHVAQLWWQNNDGSVTDSKSIRSGDSASLLLFVCRVADRKYFPYFPTNRQTGETKIPNEQACFLETKNFYIQIHHSYNQILKFPVRVSKKFDGKLYFEIKNGSSLLLE